MITTSLCMIVKNEEKVLARCLDSLEGLFDEIIIVDTGSTDSTKDIALKYTDNVYDFQWIDDFSAARNFAFSKCTKEYIYSADADEILDEVNYQKFKLLKETLVPEIEIVQMWYVNTHEFATTENFEKERRPKLYKRLRNFTWIDPIHESVNLNPVLYDSDIEIIHKPLNSHSKRDFHVFIKALERGEGISPKLHRMYADELLISGELSDYEEAENYFVSSIYDTNLDQDNITRSYCVLTKLYRLKGVDSQFFKYALKNIVIKPCSEICYELGLYYQELGDYDEACMWYQNAISETVPISDATSNNKKPLEKMAECYEAMAEINEFMREHLLEEASELRKKISEISLY